MSEGKINFSCKYFHVYDGFMFLGLLNLNIIVSFEAFMSLLLQSLLPCTLQMSSILNMVQVFAKAETYVYNKIGNNAHGKN